ncbi:hypothetical protein VNI00_009681 [Paramarasmius palmivorus]|uniref:Uncharacterized protein n=1 Tax=Paramarasmius palmivorus TaxID=297713 RepID=A0AAW0CM22_9AGAR
MAGSVEDAHSYNHSGQTEDLASESLRAKAKVLSDMRDRYVVEVTAKQETIRELVEAIGKFNVASPRRPKLHKEEVHTEMTFCSRDQKYHAFPTTYDPKTERESELDAKTQLTLSMLMQGSGMRILSLDACHARTVDYQASCVLDIYFHTSNGLGKHRGPFIDHFFCDLIIATAFRFDLEFKIELDSSNQSTTAENQLGERIVYYKPRLFEEMGPAFIEYMKDFSTQCRFPIDHLSFFVQRLSGVLSQAFFDGVCQIRSGT